MIPKVGHPKYNFLSKLFQEKNQYCTEIAPHDFRVLISSLGGLEVEQWTDNSTLSISMGSNLARRQKDFRSYSNTTGNAIVNNVQKLSNSIVCPVF